MRTLELIYKIKQKLTKIEKEKVLIPVYNGCLLKDRIAFITGGSSGIGYAIASSFLRNGAKVIISGRNIDRLNIAKDKLIKETDCNESDIICFELDITRINYNENKLNSFLDQYKNIDIFVNNAGINKGESFPNTDLIDYENVLDTNLKGMYFFSQYIFKYMIKNKIHGNILIINSSSSLRPAITPYIVSKWGERSLTLGMAKKALQYGITVNGLAPGSTLTPMLEKGNKTDLSLDYSPIKRYIAPEEIGNMATFLVSDMGKTIIGDTIYMTGGAGVITYDDMQY
ncbi:SDR family NAD(P)-dependent oxidoreductase [Thomasclavelia sp.]|uniref:SDR family NAD(P)-dependent oxidoreductase n=1 Tax=Thomasclavelia sp. TaxID=3025757 RepID=UPI0025CE313A|nr:SDR family oxidoreductase [Thomasclavelia sp.]